MLRFATIFANIDPAKTETGPTIIFRVRYRSSTCRWRDSLSRQAPKYRIKTLRRQLGPSVEPPGQHGHVSANDVLDDKLARDGIRGILTAGCSNLIPHQIRKYLANAAKADDAAAAADERPIVVHMVAGMFEHGQAEAQTSVPVICSRSQSFSLPIGELLAQLIEAPPL
jgi:hypothetical protein